MTKKTRWGIIGTGTMACDFATGLNSLPDAELIAVASRTETRSADFASAFGLPHHFHSYESLADCPDIDVIHIATPNHRHAEDVIMCLEKGKPVLCEKPFTIKSSDARRVVETARAKNLFCMEAMWMRFMPLVQRVKKELAAGVIGQPHLLVADFGYPVANNSGNRFFNPELGGGGLLDRGVYPLSLSCYLFGLPDNYSGQCVQADSGVDSAGSLSLSWNNGTVASLHYSMSERTTNTAIIYGSEGKIMINAPFFRPHRVVVRQESNGVDEFDAIAAAGSNSGLKGRAKGRVKSLLQRTKRRMESLTPPKIVNRGATWSDYDKGNGYQHEAAEVCRCLNAGLLESESMPLDESVAIVELTENLIDGWS